VSLSGQAQADRDFALEWTPARGSEPQAALFTEEWRGEFYSLLVVQPPAEVSAAHAASRLEREIIFVLDTSGSMSGASIQQAKAALALALDRLSPDDRFNVIEFNSQARRLWPESLPAYVEHVEEARRWVEGLEADGGTEILAALLLALDARSDLAGRDENRLRQVVFVTDGCVGNEDEIFREIRGGLGETRLFTVGIGSAPNAYFLRQAAAAGRGSYTFVGRPEDVRTHMAELLRKLENPVLADVAVVWDEASSAPIPERVPDLYAGEPLVVVAKLANPSGATLSGSGQQTWSDRVESARAVAGKGIHAVWARRRIAQLEDSALEGAAADEIRAGIVEVALAHGLVSRHTSLVAVDVTPTASVGPAPARHVPVHLPAGWNGAGFGELPQGATPARLYLICGLGMLIAASWLAWPRGRS
jgi:Ca-activated chloride channel family protein